MPDESALRRCCRPERLVRETFYSRIYTARAARANGTEQLIHITHIQIPFENKKEAAFIQAHPELANKALLSSFYTSFVKAVINDVNVAMELKRNGVPSMVSYIKKEIIPGDGYHAEIFLATDILSPLTGQLDDPGLTHEYIVDVARRLAAMVKDLHSNGVVHRGITPDYLYLGVDQKLLLGGFFYSMRNSKPESPYTPILTFAHMAPDVAAGQRGTLASDMYSIASIMKAAYLGTPAGETPPDIALPAEVPDSIQEAIRVGMSLDPSQFDQFRVLLNAAKKEVKNYGQTPIRLNVPTAKDADEEVLVADAVEFIDITSVKADHISADKADSGPEPKAHSTATPDGTADETTVSPDRAPGGSVDEEYMLPLRHDPLRYEYMIPANEDSFTHLLSQELEEFRHYAEVVPLLGYSNQGQHGATHVLRVLLLALIYARHGDIPLTDGDLNVLVYFSLFHDIGRKGDGAEQSHGDAALTKIGDSQDIIETYLRLTDQEKLMAGEIIRHHCHDDRVGYKKIAALQGLSETKKRKAITLYNICKDLDSLDRVRFDELDCRFLRTDYARKLPLIAKYLYEQDVRALAGLQPADDAVSDDVEADLDVAEEPKIDVRRRPIMRILIISFTVCLCLVLAALLGWIAGTNAAVSQPLETFAPPMMTLFPTPSPNISEPIVAEPPVLPTIGISETEGPTGSDSPEILPEVPAPSSSVAPAVPAVSSNPTPRTPKPEVSVVPSPKPTPEPMAIPSTAPQVTPQETGPIPPTPLPSPTQPNVTATLPPSMEPTPEPVLSVSQSAVVINEGGGKMVSSNVAATAWSSSDPEIATVRDGYIFGVAPGTCTVTASYNRQTVKITVVVN